MQVGLPACEASDAKHGCAAASDAGVPFRWSAREGMTPDIVTLKSAYIGQVYGAFTLQLYSIRLEQCVGINDWYYTLYMVVQK